MFKKKSAASQSLGASFGPAEQRDLPVLDAVAQAAAAQLDLDAHAFLDLLFQHILALDAEIAGELEEPVQRPEHRLGDEIEPAPVDQQF